MARGAATPSGSSRTPPSAAPPVGSKEHLLQVQQSTSTPWWSQVLTLLRYRSSYNYRNPAWLGPRIMDKLIFSLIILTLYLNVGAAFDAQNVVNMGASLFMWCTLPAFGAASYVPSIVLGESNLKSKATILPSWPLTHSLPTHLISLRTPPVHPRALRWPVYRLRLPDLQDPRGGVPGGHHVYHLQLLCVCRC